MAVVSVGGWLPVGSVVQLRGGERLVMVAGQMQVDGDTGRYWDYLGYPYPEGRANADEDLFFNADFIEEVCFVGYQDAVGVQYEDVLRQHEDEFRRRQAELAREHPDPGRMDTDRGV